MVDIGVAVVGSSPVKLDISPDAPVELSSAVDDASLGVSTCAELSNSINRASSMDENIRGSGVCAGVAGAHFWTWIGNCFLVFKTLPQCGHVWDAIVGYVGDDKYLVYVWAAPYKIESRGLHHISTTCNLSLMNHYRHWRGHRITSSQNPICLLYRCRSLQWNG